MCGSQSREKILQIRELKMSNEQQMPNGKVVTNITSLYLSSSEEIREVLRRGIYAGIYVVDAPRQDQIAEAMRKDPAKVAKQVKLFLRGIITEEELNLELTP